MILTFSSSNRVVEILWEPSVDVWTFSFEEVIVEMPLLPLGREL